MIGTDVAEFTMRYSCLWPWIVMKGASHESASHATGGAGWHVSSLSQQEHSIPFTTTSSPRSPRTTPPALGSP
jgi:hypothetical protein